jgi:hypothetical protein
MKLVTVGRFPSVTEATLAKGLLQQEGIKASIAGSDPEAHRDVPVGCILQVREEDAARAAELLTNVTSKTTERMRHLTTKRADRLNLLLLVVILGVVLVVAVAILVIGG